MLGVFDSAGRVAARAGAHALLPSLQSDAVGSPHHLISELNTQPTDTPVQRLQVQPYDCPRMARGQGGSLHLPCTTLSFATPCRFYPGAIQIDNLPHALAGHLGIRYHRHMAASARRFSRRSFFVAGLAGTRLAARLSREPRFHRTGGGTPIRPRRWRSTALPTRLIPAPCRRITTAPIARSSGWMLFCCDRGGSPQAFHMDLKSGETRQLTGAAELDGASIALLPDDRSFCYFADAPCISPTSPPRGSASCTRSRRVGTGVRE